MARCLPRRIARRISGELIDQIVVQRQVETAPVGLELRGHVGSPLPAAARTRSIKSDCIVSNSRIRDEHDHLLGIRAVPDSTSARDLVLPLLELSATDRSRGQVESLLSLARRVRAVARPASQRFPRGAPPQVKALLIEILETGRVEISPHAWKEMADDQMTVQDVHQVLRGGVAEPGEQRQDSWRYRVRQGHRYVVVTV